MTERKATGTKSRPLLSKREKLKPWDNKSYLYVNLKKNIRQQSSIIKFKGQGALKRYIIPSSLKEKAKDELNVLQF
jgi:hypothetical protein